MPLGEESNLLLLHLALMGQAAGEPMPLRPFFLKLGDVGVGFFCIIVSL